MISRMSGITCIVGLLIFQIFYKRVILSKIRLRKISRDEAFVLGINVSREGDLRLIVSLRRGYVSGVKKVGS